jgi:hypothetical protein
MGAVPFQDATCARFRRSSATYASPVDGDLRPPLVGTARRSRQAVQALLGKHMVLAS